MKTHLLPLSTLALATAFTSTAAAQTEVFGVDVRIQRSFMSDIGSFTANFVALAGTSEPLFAIDFDSLGQTLYGIDNTTLDILTMDLVTGLWTPTGTQATGIGGATGLTASADGTTWYVSEFDGADTLLYSGDINTGVFTLIGTISTGIIIDISIDSLDNMYAHSISTDELLSVDTSTGVGTVIGATGFAANFAQGMDFDWSTDSLYATIYTGGGTGGFCIFDLITGAATLLDDTLSLNAEMEPAFPVGSDGSLGSNYCMANANSTGGTGSISASGSPVASANDVTLTADGLPNQSFGFFITSQLQGFVMNPAGSEGNLCVLGQIGRYVGPGQIQNTGTAGSFSLVLDLTQTPQPNGLVSVMGGETWNFQAWHRDTDSMGVPTSNFTDGLEIDFL